MLIDSVLKLQFSLRTQKNPNQKMEKYWPFSFSVYQYKTVEPGLIFMTSLYDLPSRCKWWSQSKDFTVNSDSSCV